MGHMYDDDQVERTEGALPAWYRNTPGQMVAREVVINNDPLRRPADLSGQPTIFPGGGPGQTGTTELVCQWSGQTDAPVGCSLLLSAEYTRAGTPDGPIYQSDVGASLPAGAVFEPVYAARTVAGQNVRVGGGATPDTGAVRWNNECQNTGFYTVQYGVGGSQRVIRFDIQDCCISLPPVSFVKVSVTRYWGGYTLALPSGGLGADTPADQPIRCRAALCAGTQSGEEDGPIFTAGIWDIPDEPGFATTVINLVPPPGAVSFLWGSNDIDQLSRIAVQGAIQTHGLQQTSTGAPPLALGFLNVPRPDWGPAIPPTAAGSAANGSAPGVVRMAVSNAGTDTVSVFAGWRLSL